MLINLLLTQTHSVKLEVLLAIYKLQSYYNKKPEETPNKNPFLTKHQQKLMKEAEEALTVAEKEEYLKTRKWREASL